MLKTYLCVLCCHEFAKNSVMFEQTFGVREAMTDRDIRGSSVSKNNRICKKMFGKDGRDCFGAYQLRWKELFKLLKELNSPPPNPTVCN